jgi:hypothetical protein
MQETYFTSVTTWQGDDGWQIEILVEGFASIIDAALFGYCIRSLVREGDCLILIDSDGDRLQLRDRQIRVFQLKCEAQEKSMSDRQDFIEKEIPIELFSEVKGLNKKRFGSLSFGVLEQNSNRVLFDVEYFEKSEKNWSFTNYNCPPENELISTIVHHR